MNISANYKAVPLSGTMGESDLGGNGVSGTSVHRVYCISPGSIDITAKGGGKFSWNANTNEFIDVVVKEVTVNTGDFIGFKARTFGDQTSPFNK